MRLKNKATGEIGYTAVLRSKAIVVMDENAIQLGSYTSLAELNKEWEDYEEPKEYWFIDCDGEIMDAKYEGTGFDKDCKAIGNYFETKEEAEKAVEKLKAWKRLKDNGFKFVGTNNSKRKTGYFINYELEKSFNSQNECEQAMKDLSLLFRGEE
ncbi:MAG: hypothetical protein J6S67_03420 [Methanobrevibacter sp.]|nr:hypothetical protein [Methanobrevibacter sp.]